MEETIIKQQAESVKLSKMSKGYQWEIRVFIDSDPKLIEANLDRLEFIDKELQRRYGYNGE